MPCQRHRANRARQLISLALVVLVWVNWTCLPGYSSDRSSTPAKADEVNTSARSAQPNSPETPPATVSTVSAPSLRKADEPGRQKVSETYGKLPLNFEANHGQTDEEVKFSSRGSGYSLFLTPTEAVMALGKPTVAKTKLEPSHGKVPERRRSGAGAVLRMKLMGANPQPHIEGLEKLPGTTNYFIGNDPKKWRTNVSNYARVKYSAVYPGVDMVYYGNQRQLEYDFIVAPGANPELIKLSFDGADRISVDGNGDLVLKVKGGEVRQHKPAVYQVVGGQRREVTSRYVLKGKRRIGFELGAYDVNRPLIIDPVLSYSTYLGGSGADMGEDIAVDSSGNAYVSGQTLSINFPTANPLQPTKGVNEDAFVSKLDATGAALVYSTYLGGNSYDYGVGIAVDSAGNAYVTGPTRSTDFPTANALQPTKSGGDDVFVAKLDATGAALVYSTYLGGNGPDYGSAIAVDSAGNAYLTGNTISTNFPTANPLQPTRRGFQDAFVVKLDTAGTTLVYSTYFGGSGSGDLGDDYSNGIAVDSAGNAYVTGYTRSTSFPTANPLQPTFGGGNYDAFVAKLDAEGEALVYSTYLGGSSEDFGRGIAVDSGGNAYVTGVTESTNFPTANPLQPTKGDYEDAFVAKLDAAGTTLVYSTYLGGSGAWGSDSGADIAVDSSGNAYVTGRTGSENFPTANAIQPTGDSGYHDVFVTKLDATGAALVYSTYLGGDREDYGGAIAVDPSGNAYVTGQTRSTNFPTANPLQSTNGGGWDAFITKISIHGISGQVTNAEGGGLGAVTMTLTGSQNRTTQTDAEGNYSFADLPAGGNYTVTPSKSPYSFAPPSQSFTNLNVSQTADFTVVIYSINGRVTDAGGNGVQTATLTLSGLQAGTTQSDAGGFYSFARVAAGGNYTVTPSKTDPYLTYTFTPPSRSFSNLEANQTADFSAATSIVTFMYPVADAYVQDGIAANTNFGASQTLYLQTDVATNNDKNRDSYFKFDVGGVSGNIDSAKLQIDAAVSVAGSGLPDPVTLVGIETSAYAVSNTGWVESGTGGITWGNKPPRSFSPISVAPATVTSMTFAAYEIDVTAYVKSEMNAGQRIISLALHNPNAGPSYITIKAREAPVGRPRLVVTARTTNAPPTVSLTSPANGATYTAPANITVSANALDPESGISQVEFFAGTTSIGTDATSPYQITWSNVPVGNYSLRAVATDHSGASTTSDAAAVTVKPLTNSPTVAMLFPVNDATFAAGSNISLAASAADSDGTISKVEFFAGTTLIATSISPTTAGSYVATWSNAASGAHTLTAKATDNSGGATTSDAVTVSVVGQTGLSPTADAYVRDGPSAGASFGSAAELQMQVSTTSGDNRESYLKFDLASVSDVTSARVRLFGRLSDASASNLPVTMHPVSNTSWTETVTWNTKPAAGQTPFSTVTITDDVARWYEWDVTSYVQSEKSAGRSTISLAMQSTVVGSAYATFNSREADSNRPQLLILTTAPREALLVTGFAPLNGDDEAIRIRLQNLGYTVTVKNADLISPSPVNVNHADGKAVVVISSTVNPANIGAMFRHVAVPVVTWEFDILDDQGMVGPLSGVDFGTAEGQTQLAIAYATHPLAANLSGTLTVVTAANSFTWGRPNTDAAKIATLVSDATKVAIFGYERDAAMSGLAAPARRVGLFLTDTTAATLTNDGWTLFEAAIKWAAETPIAPTISSLNPTSGPIGTVVTVSGYNFGEIKGTSTLSFNGVTTTPSSWSSTSIVVPVPAGATTGPVVITVNGMAGNGVNFTVDVPPIDTDGDGLPDAWELQHFGNLNQTANGDADGDGLTNIQEYQQGRNPTTGAQADDGTGVNLRVYTPLVPPNP